MGKGIIVDMSGSVFFISNFISHIRVYVRLRRLSHQHWVSSTASRAFGRTTNSKWNHMSNDSDQGLKSMRGMDGGVREIPHRPIIHTIGIYASNGTTTNVRVLMLPGTVGYGIAPSPQ